MFREGSYHVGTVIDVDSTLCDLVDTLHLRVKGSSILVAHVMGAVCQWEEWTDSQWVTIGDTSRSFLAAPLLGIGDFVEFAIQQSVEIPLVEFRQVVHRTEHIYRSGFICFVRELCCVGHFKIDDRLLVMLLAIEAEIQFEMAHIADLCKCVWES